MPDVQGHLKNTVLKALPITQWLGEYSKPLFIKDIIAAFIVTVMLIPQSLAYALLAGVPPEVGLYASILPLIAHAIFGSSRTLSVGPVAIISLMTASVAGSIAAQHSADYLTVVVMLAGLSGIILLAMGILKLGLLANLISHPVISGFITASAIIIAVSQIRHLLGIDAQGHQIPELVVNLASEIHQINWITFSLGCSVLLFLVWAKMYLKPTLQSIGFSEFISENLAKSSAILGVILSVFFVWVLNLEKQGVAIVGSVPTGLPTLRLPEWDFSLVNSIFLSALFISLIGFVESISIAQTLAAKRRQRIDPNQELMGLGAANIASSVSGGMPVTGGFSRSIVNFEAGAVTPAAGAFTALGICTVALFFTPVLFYLPKATLAATIIVAVVTLIDVSAIKRTWRYSKSDFISMLTTIVITLGLGVELGILSGVLLSLSLHFYRTSKPHSAIVGRVPGTEHFRNVNRYKVEIDPAIISLRIDESLYFANARYLEDRVYDLVIKAPKTKHVILVCPAVNTIDASALESLEAINQRLADSGVALHLSEVKGPVMDQLQKSNFEQQLTGEIFMSQYSAWQALRNV